MSASPDDGPNVNSPPAARVFFVTVSTIGVKINDGLVGWRCTEFRFRRRCHQNESISLQSQGTPDSRPLCRSFDAAFYQTPATGFVQQCEAPAPRVVPKPVSGQTKITAPRRQTMMLIAEGHQATGFQPTARPNYQTLPAGGIALPRRGRLLTLKT
ncbi:hypothetical protein [Larkinella arboricola]